MNTEKELKESKKEKVTPPWDRSGEKKPSFRVKCGSFRYNKGSSAYLFQVESMGLIEQYRVLGKGRGACY